MSDAIRLTEGKRALRDEAFGRTALGGNVRLRNRRIVSLGLTVLVAALAPAYATAAPPQRTSVLVVYGEDGCPKGEGDEIVVCARQPESERYRIPKALRRDPDARPTEVSWASRVASLEDASRPSRPGSCSVVGSGGQSGCTMAAIRQWFDERRFARSRP